MGSRTLRVYAFPVAVAVAPLPKPIRTPALPWSRASVCYSPADLALSTDGECNTSPYPTWLFMHF